MNDATNNTPDQNDFNATCRAMRELVGRFGIDESVQLVLDALSAQCADLNDFEGRSALDHAAAKFSQR